MAGSFVTCLKPRCPANPTAGEGDWSPEAQGAPRAEQELPGILRLRLAQTHANHRTGQRPCGERAMIAETWYQVPM